MTFRWKRYTDTVSNIGEVMITLFFILPIGVVLMAFLAPGSTGVVTIMMMVVLPGLTLAMLVVISMIQPKTYDVITASWFKPVVAGASATAASLVLRQPFVSVSVFVLVTSGMYGMQVRNQLREISKLEQALPTFLRDITEYKKLGYDIQSTILRLSDEVTYNPYFDSLLGAVVKQIRLGLPLANLNLKLRSWFGQIVFFILTEVAETGGGTPLALEMLSNFISEVHRVKTQSKSAMKLYEALTYATPIGLTVGIAMMLGLITSFTSTLGSLPGAPSILSVGTAVQSLASSAGLLVVVAAICIALVAGKAMDFTTKSTFRIAINAGLALVCVAFLTPISHILFPALVPAGAG
jgi:flagellar protein FlaJ